MMMGSDLKGMRELQQTETSVDQLQYIQRSSPNRMAKTNVTIIVPRAPCSS